jgi:hypothetical protein
VAKIDIVTQSELAAVLASYNAIRQTILDIRRRIEAGAAVEEGIYTADSNPGDPISGYDRALNGIGMFGLDMETKGLPSDVYDNQAATKGPELVPAPESPDWWRDGTPLRIEYSLSMVVDGTYKQDVELTRGEFIALKEHLGATIRGYEPMETPDV